MSGRSIELRGVRVHNLKEVDLDIPHGQFVSICGVSGSGKSSLAFDTLYAEGQRRYFESLSPFTRQFLEQLDKPDADRIDGIPPAISIRAEQTRYVAGRASQTVGSASEILPLLRLLFAKIGKPFCPQCSLEVTNDDPRTVAKFVRTLAVQTRYQLAFEYDVEHSAGSPIDDLRALGFRRVVWENRSYSVDDLEIKRFPNDQPLLVVVDRLVADGDTLSSRLLDSAGTAFQRGGGRMSVLWPSEPDSVPERSLEIDGKVWHNRLFSSSRSCPQCDFNFSDPVPQSFDVGSPLGACESCQGTGQESAAGKRKKTGKRAKADEAKRCSACNGCGLNEFALAFQIVNRNLPEFCAMEIDAVLDLLNGLSLDAHEQQVADKPKIGIEERLQFLARVGIGYLTLNRSVGALSAGELQRVLLTKALSSTLSSLLYVLDEPTSGLHPVELPPIVEVIRQLQKRNNTIVVVDHNQEMIASADRIIEIGPAAGNDGGSIIFDGTADTIKDSADSVTGQFLAVRAGLRDPDRARRNFRKSLKLIGASGNNLQNVDVEFPLGSLCAVSGVSGAGKSSLIQGTLYPAVSNRDSDEPYSGLPYMELVGAEQCDEVVLVDHSPIGRSSRSNPVTYVKAFDDIRNTFADTVDAKMRNLTAGHFSFNVDGGRCEKCRGEGSLAIEMHFMADIQIACDHCNGARYRDTVLEVKYRARNIDDVLKMTAREAFTFFRGKTKVQAKLKALIDVGLEYIRLGQPATTLSSGEAQRLKLAHYLNAAKSKRVLFLLDEPTFGLHPQDILKLVDCFDTLIAAGNSLIVIEHNLHLLKHADWIIDLGPGASNNGGTIVAEGTPEQVAQCAESVTGRFLGELLSSEKASLAALVDE